MQTAISVATTVYRYVFCCKRFVKRFFQDDDVTPFSIKVPITKLPWMWVGVKLHDGKLMTITDELNYSIAEGDIITRNFISRICGINERLIKGCYYLDAQTLEEKEFPPEGLTIRNDTE